MMGPKDGGRYKNNNNVNNVFHCRLACYNQACQPLIVEKMKGAAEFSYSLQFIAVCIRLNKILIE